MPMPHGLNRWSPVSIRAALGCAALGASALAAQTVSPSAVADEARMSPEAALKILLGDAAPGMLRPVAQPASASPAQAMAEALPAGSALRVVVRPGDTVDGLLRRHLGDSAFSAKFQRQALMRLNPSVFQKGQVHRLEVGSTLWIPTDQTLMGLLSGAKPELQMAQAKAPKAQEVAVQNPSGTVPAPTYTPSPTRGWVRYP